MSTDVCPACKSELSAGYRSWHFVCKRCGYEKANLQPSINSSSSHKLIDEGARETGLRELRIGNFKKLLMSIKSIGRESGHLLDVGCAHGWFLDLAKNDFKVLGLEPDKSVFAATIRRGLPVRMGYFPEVLDDSETFDVIVFNDVIEHIPDILHVLASCHQRLNHDGLLVLNLPSSSGLFYRVSKILCRLGLYSFFERMWQKDLPSPHLHYFNLANLIDLLQKNSFEVKTSGALKTLSLQGLYTRVSYAKKRNFLSLLFVYLSVALSLPIIKFMPADIIYVISMRK
jgi:2-polyprenyl-3-methyl-5-hydroxy-6-metoxy-1,4-benzoquinol methylase